MLIRLNMAICYFYLRNRSAPLRELLSINSLLEVSCKEDLNHERAARVMHLRTTDRQTVNYYSTIHVNGAYLFRF